ncbi:MAG: heavy-metal-associated domain-containing protein [Gaiellaceae bacterium]
MTTLTETLEVDGIRCERCVMRLAAALQGHEGLEAANANLVGQVTLTYDDERTSRDTILTAMAKAGFRERE